MINYYLKLYVLTFKRFRTTFLINLIGLSFGLACSLLIYLWIYDELSYDKFHQNERDLYKIMVNSKSNIDIKTSDGTSSILGASLKQSYPEVKLAVASTPAAWFRKFNLSFQGKAVKATGNFVGKDFFKVFSYRLITGSKQNVLADKSSIVISKALAEKLFNTTTGIVGKQLEWKWADLTKQYVITGIFENFPFNSSQQYDCLLPLESWENIVSRSNDISGGPYTTYVVLGENTSVDDFNRKVSNYIRKKNPKSNSSLFLTKYSDLYLYSKFENGVNAGGRIEYVKLFSLIAIFILVIACINFMNLATAKTSERIKDIGIRKALGAERHALIIQFLGEAVLMSFISLIVAVFLVVVILPVFNRITDKHLEIGLNIRLIISVIIITIITGLLAGSYPAFYLSGLKPVVTLKGKFVSGMKNLWVRKGLVFFQFSLSIIFIVTMMVVYNQTKFIQEKNLGFNKDNVIYFEMEGQVAKKLETFFYEVKKIPGVIQASSIQNSVILPTFSPAPGVYWEDKNVNDEILFHHMEVNYDLLETLNIGVTNGRSFSRRFGTDTNAIIINESAKKAMGLREPINTLVNVWGKKKYIIGVAKDFHFNSLHEEIKPFIFGLDPKSTLLVMIRINGQNQKRTLDAIKNFYSNFNPGSFFEFKFLDDDYQAQYASENLVGALSKYFALLAIVIASLGLFGLASFMVERRIREIGIRKTLGASEYSIVFLLTSEFTQIVLVSIAVGIPLSYFITWNWLSNFVYRIPLKPWYFIITAIFTLLTAWLTVGSQTIKASLINPIKSLKVE